ncbi:MAG: hypothetical protein IJI47_02550 [Eubacterium sp.]|nr:hypothetical protein [Eubacterium sp.]MBR0412433.1 hypothetical protein [Eubacterium sp.]
MSKRIKMRRIPKARVRLTEQEFNELLQKPYLTVEDVQPFLEESNPDYDEDFEWKLHEDLAKGMISDEVFDIISGIEN